ncbi:hypothetical protein KQX54_003181 [Cotesia glomerata]|uniref:Uncharacterized protein n=1 Tax=Cotesia glomerata TaxID=32391 RepID=A0AAV7IML7_COTGL|nr:hypothetical protein KQX54_003181 [Cotesia glomerata]
MSGLADLVPKSRRCRLKTIEAPRAVRNILTPLIRFPEYEPTNRTRLTSTHPLTPSPSLIRLELANRTVQKGARPIVERREKGKGFRVETGVRGTTAVSLF